MNREYDQQIALRLSSDTVKKLDSRARREGRTRANLMRLLIERSLRREKPDAE